MYNPIGKRVLLERFSYESHTPSGVLFFTNTHRIQRARVARDYQDEETDLKEGDCVLFENARIFPVGGGNQFVIARDQIIGVAHV